MKNLLKIFTSLTLLLAYTTNSSVSAPKDTDFPTEIVSEDLELNRDNLQETIKNTELLLVFFYDRQDARMEKTTTNIRKAVTNLRKVGLDIQLGKFEAPVTPRIEKTYHVYSFPKVIIFLNGERHPLTAPPYPKQIEAFVKRIVREQDQTISIKLRDKEMFGTLIDREGTLVVYCGKNKDQPEFSTYEGVARDAKQIYVYSFDEKICRWIHLRYMGKESKLEWIEQVEVPMTEEESTQYHDAHMKDLQKQLENEQITEEDYNRNLHQYPKVKVVDKRHFNETLWKEAALNKPIIFICQKNQEEKSAVKMIEDLSNVKKIRKEIKYLSEPGYYTDLDNVRIFTKQNEFKNEWLILFYQKGENESHPLIGYFKSWARQNLFKLGNLKLAILDSSQITMLGLEQAIPIDQYLRFYYFKYIDQNESKLLKHKMVNVQNPNQVKLAINWIRNSEWDPYYFSEKLDGEKDTLDSREGISKRFKKLVRTNYFSTIEDRGEHILIVARKRGSIKKFSEIIEEFYEKISPFNLQEQFKFYHINVELNDLDMDMQNGIKFMFHHKNKEEIRTSFNIDTVDSLIRFLAETAEELQPLIENSDL